jgi:hypothetical protein
MLHSKELSPFIPFFILPSSTQGTRVFQDNALQGRPMRYNHTGAKSGIAWLGI